MVRKSRESMLAGGDWIGREHFNDITCPIYMAEVGPSLAYASSRYAT